MRVFYTPGSDPMLLDAQSGMRALHDALEAFLKSPERSTEFSAATDKSPAPYAEFLQGLRMVKGAGDARLTLSADGWLVLTGAVEELAMCVERFVVTEEHEHRHLYTVPVSLIIEVDSAWEHNVAP